MAKKETELTFSVKDCISYVDEVKIIKQLRKQVSEVFKVDEIKSYVTMSKKYKKALSKEKASRALLIITSYHERLHSIRIDMSLLENSIYSHINIIKREFKCLEGFTRMSKVNQDSWIDIEMGHLIDFHVRVQTMVTILNQSIDFLNSIQFNLKSVLTSLKGYGNSA